MNWEATLSVVPIFDKIIFCCHVYFVAVEMQRRSQEHITQ